MFFVINGAEHKTLEIGEAENQLTPLEDRDDLEIWAVDEDGASLCALLNSQRGWLMFQRFPEDTGFSSRNRKEIGDESNLEEFVLANGQVDSYPRSWTFERATILDALRVFAQSGTRPSFVDWHDDAAQ